MDLTALKELELKFKNDILYDATSLRTPFADGVNGLKGTDLVSISVRKNVDDAAIILKKAIGGSDDIVGVLKTRLGENGFDLLQATLKKLDPKLDVKNFKIVDNVKETVAGVERTLGARLKTLAKWTGGITLVLGVILGSILGALKATGKLGGGDSNNTPVPPYPKNKDGSGGGGGGGGGGWGSALGFGGALKSSATLLAGVGIAIVVVVLMVMTDDGSGGGDGGQAG